MVLAHLEEVASPRCWLGFGSDADNASVAAAGVAVAADTEVAALTEVDVMNRPELVVGEDVDDIAVDRLLGLRCVEVAGVEEAVLTILIAGCSGSAYSAYSAVSSEYACSA